MTEFASFATVVSGTSLEHEFAAAYKIPSSLLEFQGDDQKPNFIAVCACSAVPDPTFVFHVYLSNRYPIFRAWFRLEALGPQSPGAPDLKAIVGMVCGDLGVPVERLAAGYAEEIQRSWDHSRGAPVEITTVASVVGGIAANEAVKLIVQKFQPINNSVIYDGANLEYCVDFKI